MKRRFAAGLLLALVCSAVFIAIETQAAPENEKMLRHVVVLKFKEDATREQVQQAVDDLVALPRQISEIAAFEHGLNNSKEGRSKGFTHCFLISFKDEQALATYLPHPAHVAFVQKNLPLIEDVLVVDYWTGQ